MLDPSGREVILADSIDGKLFSRLNDLVVGRNDRIYFTDENGVYVTFLPGGKVTTIDPVIANPNGVMLSPDEKILYANDKDGQYVIAYDVAPDGTVRNRRNFARYKSVRIPGHKDPLLNEDNGADGMAIDTDGRLYVATNAGVEVFSPKGDLLGVIPAVFGGEQNDLQKPQNVTFGGPDGRRWTWWAAAWSSKCRRSLRASRVEESRRICHASSLDSRSLVCLRSVSRALSGRSRRSKSPSGHTTRLRRPSNCCPSIQPLTKTSPSQSRVVRASSS